jgi:hypothetical protein
MDVANHSGRSVARVGISTAVGVSSITNGKNTPETQPILKASSVKTSRRFAPNASIVLVGIRGCGKTSLGYIAARALGRRLVVRLLNWHILDHYRHCMLTSRIGSRR